MSPYICLLIILSDGEELLRCALKVDGNMFKDRYFLEDYNKKIIYKLLPEHVSSDRTIVEVQEIFEVEDKSNE